MVTAAEGVGLTGIPVKINEIKKFVVLGDLFGEVVPFEFEAICWWSTTDRMDGRPEAGFLVTHISDQAFLELQKVIRLVTFQALTSADTEVCATKSRTRAIALFVGQASLPAVISDGSELV